MSIKNYLLYLGGYISSEDIAAGGPAEVQKRRREFEAAQQNWRKR